MVIRIFRKGHDSQNPGNARMEDAKENPENFVIQKIQMEF
jgi:hypothetical protein